MRTTIIFSTVMIHMQLEYFATLVNRLKIEAETIKLFSFFQWKFEVGLTIFNTESNVFLQ